MRMRHHLRGDMAGVLLALASAVCFATLPILVRYAYGEGLGVEQLIAGRFLVAAAGLWILCAVTGQAPWRIGTRSLAILGLMGLTLYSLQAFSFIFAVRTVPVSLVSLVLYSYPALVAIGARAVFGRRLTLLHVGALAASFAGVALLVGGVGRVVPSPGLLLAGVAPLVYSVYILAGDSAMRPAVPAVPAATVVMTASAATFTVVAALTGELRLPGTAAGGELLLAIGVVPTVAAITLFLAALPRVGAGRAAVLSTAEPLVTVGLAALLLGERLTWPQAAGGALVLAAVVALQRRPG